MSARVLEMITLIPITRAHGLEENESRIFLDVRRSGLQLDYVTALVHSTS